MLYDCVSWKIAARTQNLFDRWHIFFVTYVFVKAMGIIDMTDTM